MKYSALCLFLLLFVESKIHAADNGPLDLYWSPAFSNSLVSDYLKPCASFKVVSNYALPQLTDLSSIVIKPYEGFSSFISFRRNGFRQYNETVFTGGLSKPFGRNITAAISLGMIRIRIPETAYSKLSPIADAGTTVRINSQTRFLIDIHEISGNGKRVLNVKRFVLMMDHEVGQETFLTLGIVKDDLRRSLIYLGQARYSMKNMMLSFHAASGPLRFGTGIAWKRGSMNFYGGLEYQSGLGSSPTSSITWVKS